MKILKHKVTWIDILKPDSKDIDFIRKQHKFHPLILDELLHASARSRVENYHQYLFLTYHLPMYDKVSRTSRRTEIDFLITKNKIITVHYEELEPINNFWRKISNEERFKELALGDSTAQTIYYLLEEVLDFSQRQLAHVEENVSEITKHLFQKKEGELLEKISYVKRNILDYRIISKPQGTILHSLHSTGLKFWGADMEVYLSDLIGDQLKITDKIDNFKETVESLEETNSQLLTAKTNAVVQRFSVLAFLTFPLILVIGIFTVPAIDRIFEHSPIFFTVSFILALIFNTGLLLFFKKKGWL